MVSGEKKKGYWIDDDENKYLRINYRNYFNNWLL
jgi:hypothetical protein